MRTHNDRLLLELYGLICFISIVLIAASFLNRYGVAIPGPDWQLSLGRENNFGAWWSGTLLALIALAAGDGARRARSVARGTSGAWAALAGVFIFLSADEVASLHERISLMGMADGTGRWFYLVVLGAVLGVISLWALWRLWKAGGSERTRAYLFAFGFALLAGVVLQEAIEHSRTWEDPLMNALRVTIEEGSEVCAMLVLLWATFGHSRAALRHAPDTARPPFAIVTQRANGILVAAALLAPFAIYYSVTNTDGFGQIAKWLAAMLFLAGAAVPMQNVLRRTASRSDFVTLVFCLMASVISVAVDIVRTAEFAGSQTGIKDIYLLLCVLPLALVWVRKDGTFGAVLSGALLCMAAMTMMLTHTPLTAFGIPVALGWVVFLGQAKHAKAYAIPASATIKTL